MTVNELSVEIGRAFVRDHYAEQLDAFDEYVRIVSSDLRDGAPADTSDRFGPLEALGGVIGPIVLGIVSNWLYDLLKRRLSREKAGVDRDIPRDALVQLVQESRQSLQETEAKLEARTGRPTLVKEVVGYCVAYVERQYGA
jgi:hypothetical protein